MEETDKNEELGNQQQVSQDVPAGEPNLNLPPVAVGLHPLGGIAITVRGPDGSSATARLTVDQSWYTAGHLNSLATMLVHSAYAQMEMQAQQKIVVPGS
jgi:hypothetical protein